MKQTTWEMQSARGPFRMWEQKAPENRRVFMVTNDRDLAIAVWDLKEMGEAILHGLRTGNMQIAVDLRETQLH